MKNAALAFLLIISTSLAVFGGTRDPKVPDEKYLEYGHKFEHVVLVKVVIDETPVVIDGQTLTQLTFAEASAVIIRPNWAVTAGHVVHKSKGATILRGDRKFPISKTITHKDYNDDLNGVYDIALCYSPQEFGLDKYVDLYCDDNELGMEAEISGFGRPGDFNTGAGSFDGKRRAGKNKIDGTASDILFCSPSVKDGSDLEFMITPGDSGGGLFINGRLAGINSFLRSHNPEDLGKPLGGKYGQDSAFMRVSKFRDWMEKEMARHESSFVLVGEK